MDPLKQNIEYCREYLPRVSRTFAPTIRMLPGILNHYVTVAYLLCRIADTVEDESSLSRSEKESSLNHFAGIFTGEDPQIRTRFVDSVQSVPDHCPDVTLMKNIHKVLVVYDSFPTEVRRMIGIWVVEMVMGMKKFVQARHVKRFQFLQTMRDLDEYTYYVAGTVGHLLTALFAHFSNDITPAIKNRLEKFSESFGKGLQMVNIIRDMRTDLKRGQSYIPDEILFKYKLTRQSIFEAENSDRAERLFNELIEIAVGHLDHALTYIITLPKDEKRIRLFCLLPMFWALQTLRLIQNNMLQLLRTGNVKISRRTIRIEFMKALLLAFSNRLTIHHYRKIRRDLRVQPLMAA